MLSGLLIDPALQCVSTTSAVYQTLLRASGAVWEILTTWLQVIQLWGSTSALAFYTAATELSASYGSR